MATTIGQTVNQIAGQTLFTGAGNRRLVSVWLPRFPTDRISRRQTRKNRPDWQDEAVVITAPEKGALRLQSVNRTATKAGLMAGQTLADARALEPSLIAIDADPAADRLALFALARWATRYTPWVAVGSQSGSATNNNTDETEVGGAANLWLDITGCAHLFAPLRAAVLDEADSTTNHNMEGEPALLDDLLGRLQRHGYGARAGAADTAGAAWAVARYAGARTDRSVIVPSGGQIGALADLPIAGLRLPVKTRETLDRLGLRRIGELAAMPRKGLAGRFGPQLAERLDQAYGTTAETISPLAQPPELKVQATFAEPLGQPDDIRAALTQLLDTLLTEMTLHEIGVRRLAVYLQRLSGRTEPLVVGTSRATRQTAHLLRLIDGALESLPPPPGGDRLPENFVETIEVAVLSHASLRAVQVPLPPLPGTAQTTEAIAPTTEFDPDIGPLIDRLIARLGADAVIRLRRQASHLPERAQNATRLGDDAPITAPTAPLCQTSIIRPPRLLKRPEPITVIASVPDDPPVMFRWRNRLYHVVSADGPERLSAEWWRPASPLGNITRDYYRIEERDGGRFWLYRLGLYQSDTSASADIVTGAKDGGGSEIAVPRWYLHGFFG